MKKFLPGLAVGFMIFITLNCDNSDHPDNSVTGKWKPLWAGSQNKSLDFNLSFESNNSFHIIVSGGEQMQPQTVSGIYRIHRDTFMVLDKSDEPLQLCSYADTGKYTFIKHKDSLFFKVIKDPCERRKLTLEMGLIRAR